jgi:hypothetical protein
MLTEEEQKSADSFTQRWRDGRLASQPGMATIVLAVVLLLTILAAQLIVSARSEYSQAVQNGKNLIQQISEKGLSHYLRQETSLRYFIIEEQGVPTRFMATKIEPHLQSKSFYEITEAIFDSQGRPIDRVRLIIDNQLATYKYETRFYQFRKNSHGYYQGNHPIHILDSSAQNMIPQQLLDFFSSVAATEHFDEGVILDMPNELHQISGLGYALDTFKFWIKPGGDIPAEIRKATPDGYSVHVKPLETRNPFESSQSKPVVTRQDIYYDSGHQLVWQKNVPTEVIIRSVSPQELMEAFPDASTVILKLWQNSKSKMDDPDNDAAEI